MSTTFNYPDDRPLPARMLLAAARAARNLLPPWQAARFDAWEDDLVAGAWKDPGRRARYEAAEAALDADPATRLVRELYQRAGRLLTTPPPAPVDPAPSCSADYFALASQHCECPDPPCQETLAGERCTRRTP